MEDSWNTSGIYMLTCKVNGKSYIGQSQNIAKRLRSHKSNKHKYHNYIIKNAISKYGWENFDKTVLEFCPVEKLDEREIFWIAKYQPEYNIKEGGGRGNHSIQTREILRQSTKSQWQNTDIRKIFQKQIICIETGEIFESVNSAAAKIGVNHSAISQVLNGKTKTSGGYHWDYLNDKDKQQRGKHFSEETRKQFSKLHIGQKRSEQTIAKLSAQIKKRGNECCQKSVVCMETGQIFKSVKIAALTVGVVPSFLSKVLHGKKKTAGGYHWKFIEKETD